MVVLSQLDRKYYRDLAGKASWSMDFALVKQGETEPIVEVVHSEIYTSNVNAEVELEAGTYLVYVRLNRQLTNRVRFILLSLLSHPHMILVCDKGH